MANPVYLELTGNNGNIAGDVSVEGRDGTIEIFSLSHPVTIPVNEQTGVNTGTRRHKPLILQKNVDRSSTYLFSAACTGEALPKGVLRFYRINIKGEEEHYYTILMEQVKVVDYQLIVPETQEIKNDQLGHREQFALRYTKITHQYVDGNLEASDEWDKR
ncbi:MAG: type VI secretion system tube protein Hcp [Legionellales bacterium]|nr:type VI secretion system tube protein Hcp [Legionellales bacterium]